MLLRCWPITCTHFSPLVRHPKIFLGPTWLPRKTFLGTPPTAGLSQRIIPSGHLDVCSCTSMLLKEENQRKKTRYKTPARNKTFCSFRLISMKLSTHISCMFVQLSSTPAASHTQRKTALTIKWLTYTVKHEVSWSEWILDFGYILFVDSAANPSEY